MTPPLSADEMFVAALALTEPSARSAYLNRVCAGNLILRQEVESLLAAAERAGTFLESPASGAVEVPAKAQGAAGIPLTERAGDRIGRYKLLEQIGEGGFGVVWMAEQEEPVRRRIALKIIKLGMDTKEVVARFEAERQALAMMDHPNIASVFDGSATDTGRPCFVMELVEASLRATRAGAYHDLGLHATQELHARRAAELYARELGETNAQALRMMAALGDAERHLGRGVEAVRQLQHVREIEERVFGPAHTNTLRTVNLLGVAYANAGQSDQGEALLKEALRRAEGRPAGGNPIVGELLNNLAILLAENGRLAEAEQVCRQDLALARERRGPVHLFTLRSTFHLATVLSEEQKLPESETLFREAIALSGKLLGTNEDDGTLAANLGMGTTLTTVKPPLPWWPPSKLRASRASWRPYRRTCRPS